MADISKFESRVGRLNCRTCEVFNFVTDFRNFRQFIPEESIKNWHVSDNKCSFHISPLGSVKISIKDKISCSSVLFSGEALQQNNFTILVQISENEQKKADVRILISAALNQVLKLMVSRPVEQFLEKLISEMEKFENWHDTVK
jgi:carbon monoxide dehydrogenase subunit G